MRDMVFKNLTSSDKRKRIIVSSEAINKSGINTVIHRHFICLIKEVEQIQAQKPAPYLYVLKEKNKKEKFEKFYCRIKGSLYVNNSGKLLQLRFSHSLKINIKAVSHAVNYT
jgi:hypothetical protein